MTTAMKEKIEFKGPVRYVYKKMGRAIADYSMLSAGDKVLVGVSGAPDSLALLELFRMRKQRIPIHFDFIACFIETDFVKADKEALRTHFEDAGFSYVFKTLADAGEGDNCFWCTIGARKILFEVAREHGCNKIALAHNLDTIAETTLKNLFFKGEIGTMKPKIELFDGSLSIIRPLCYLNREEIAQFISYFIFPDTKYCCLCGKDLQREKVMEMIKDLSLQYPFLKKNIFGALGRIRKDYLL